jgi:hypothetical protein
MVSVGPTKTLSFDEIIPGNSVRVTEDGMIYAVDLTMVITGKSRDQAGLALRNLSEETFQSIKFIDRNTGGRGNGRTKLVTFDDALEDSLQSILLYRCLLEESLYRNYFRY